MHHEYNWFRNYLQNPTQVVEFQNVWSTAEAVSLGVPQGFTLEPLLDTNLHLCRFSAKRAILSPHSTFKVETVYP